MYLVIEFSDSRVEMDGERRKERKRRRRSRSRSVEEERSSRQPSQPFNYDRHRTKLTKMFFRPVDLIKGGDEILLRETLRYRLSVNYYLLNQIIQSNSRVIQWAK
jgi:hypothetical protein